MRAAREKEGKGISVAEIDDDDKLLNIRRVWEGHILPDEAEKKNNNFGNVIRWARPHESPSGMLYTLDWDLVQAVARFYGIGSHEELLGTMDQVQHERRIVAQTENLATRAAALQAIQGDTQQRKIESLREVKLSKRHEDFMMADIPDRANEPLDIIRL